MCKWNCVLGRQIEFIASWCLDEQLPSCLGAWVHQGQVFWKTMSWRDWDLSANVSISSPRHPHSLVHQKAVQAGSSHLVTIYAIFYLEVLQQNRQDGALFVDNSKFTSAYALYLVETPN
jgi:hypothetical protein